MNLFVFGLGYSAERFLGMYRADVPAVACTVRSAEKAHRLAAEFPGLETFAWDGLRHDPRIGSRLGEADALIVSIAPGDRDPALAHYEADIAASNVRRIVYLSTIGVYGGGDGEWVDEGSAPQSTALRSRARVHAENGWRRLGERAGKSVFVLRLAGIYGPDRNVIAGLRAGTAKRIVRPGQVFNRIHVDDIARSIMACLSGAAPGGVFNVCDDEPAPPQDVVAWAAGLIGAQPPPEIPFEEAGLSPMAASFWKNNQRVANRRLKEQLNVELLYPTYREGLAALARDER